MLRVGPLGSCYGGSFCVSSPLPVVQTLYFFKGMRRFSMSDCKSSRESLWLGKCEGSRLVGGTRLVVFPRCLTPYRPKNTTSRDPYPPSSRDPPPSGRDPSPPSAPLWKGQGARGPGSRGGPGSWLSRTVGGLAVRIPRAGSPQRAGTPCLSWLTRITSVARCMLSRQPIALCFHVYHCCLAIPLDFFSWHCVCRYRTAVLLCHWIFQITILIPQEFIFVLDVIALYHKFVQKCM